VICQLKSHFGTDSSVSTRNKFNPDPTKDVRWGDQTFEEMMIGFWGTVVDNKDSKK